VPDRLRQRRATIDATLLCAGRTNLDTCQGDSGGPRFLRAAGGGFIQAGITSWGIGCGATGFPGVYTRLSNRGVGNFILSVTGGAGELDTSRITLPDLGVWPASRPAGRRLAPRRC
jgi:secreted trypsin-like serine protease